MSLVVVVVVVDDGDDDGEEEVVTAAVSAAFVLGTGTDSGPQAVDESSFASKCSEMGEEMWRQ